MKNLLKNRIVVGLVCIIVALAICFGLTPMFNDALTSTVEIVRASPEYAQLLDVPVGEPLFYMNIYFLDYNGQPLFVGRQYIVGKRYVLHI